MANEVILVADLVKKYNGRSTVLDGVTFTVEPGEFVMIYGKSGCGKTTLLNILGGLDRPTSGEVAIDGRSVVGMSEDALAKLRLEKIGFVFQDFNLLMDLTIRQNVALPSLFSKKQSKDRVEELLKKFGIDKMADEPANRISGGEAQRTAIARAMMNNPRIILADEPTGNLDSENTANVIATFDLVRNDYGTTIVLATHDNELAKHATKRIYLEDGKARVEG
jgi:ABC-type lipoprotein export system ATPase subunit